MLMMRKFVLLRHRFPNRCKYRALVPGLAPTLGRGRDYGEACACALLISVCTMDAVHPLWSGVHLQVVPAVPHSCIGSGNQHGPHSFRGPKCVMGLAIYAIPEYIIYYLYAMFCSHIKRFESAEGHPRPWTIKSV